ncbi:hypothetical protein PHLCEN_2v1924 [Hermanssonia centrifuga]|uniref:MYND-type domain-containing protein n=1 Tax=Hermanssonia centrifuga TaxID=98765 RepID=A0A2R6RVI8_9APHY|nr:hypothetical protein PHLCEN_2v1924 [Hermanssonia centrifuga]
MEFSLEPSHLLARLDKVALSTDRGNGSKDPLKGEEAQRLRTFCTSNSVIPARDLDQYGLALMIGDLMLVKSDFSGRVARLASATRSVEEARAAAAKELFALKWGPTRTPIYDLLIVGTVLVPSKRENQLKVAHWLVHDAKVPVNGRDLSGSTAMNHAISTKPVFDPDFAEILYEGGGDVNDRNRYGCTPAHEIIMIMDARNSQAVRAPVGAMRWFLSHGGNLDIKDNEGMTARGTFTKTCAMHRSAGSFSINEVSKVVEQDDRRRKQLGDRCCTFCGREPDGKVKLLACSRCKITKYCSLPRNCQKGDWPVHKVTCKTPEQLARAKTYLGIPIEG